jgi:hypothetical protein
VGVLPPGVDVFVIVGGVPTFVGVLIGATGQ